MSKKRARRTAKSEAKQAVRPRSAPSKRSTKKVRAKKRSSVRPAAVASPAGGFSFERRPTDIVEYVAWLFWHMETNLGDDLRQERVWSFETRPSDGAKAAILCDRLEALGYEIQAQDSMEEIVVENGVTTRSVGPPLVAALRRGVLDLSVLQAMVREVDTTARQVGTKCTKVDSFHLEEYEMIFGEPTPMDLDAALWRVRNLEDSGSTRGSPLSMTFCLRASATAKTRAAAKLAGFDVVSPGGECDWSLELTYRGKLTDASVKSAFARIQAIARSAGAEMLGVIM